MSVCVDFLVGPRRREVFTHPRCSSMQSSNIMFTGNKKTSMIKKLQYENHKEWLHGHFFTFYHWFHLNALHAMHRLLLWWNTSQSFPTKTRKVQQLLQERNIKSGVKALYSMAWTNLKRGIKRLRGTTRRGLRSIYNKDTQETISWWTPHFKRFLTSHHSLFQAGEQFLSESHQGITHHLAPYIIVDIMYNNATHVCFHAIVLYATCNGVLCEWLSP